MKRVLFLLYQVFRSIRYSLLTSVFGITSHCKHTPTCGTYFFRSIEKEGYIWGTMKGIARVARCW